MAPRRSRRTTRVSSASTVSTPVSKFSSRGASTTPASSVASTKDTSGHQVSSSSSKRKTRSGQGDASTSRKRPKLFKEVYVEVPHRKSKNTCSRLDLNANDDEGSLISEDELNYAEVEESDPSGSEFEVSENEGTDDIDDESEDEVKYTNLTRHRRQSRGGARLADDSENEVLEDIMVAKAITRSLQEGQKKFKADHSSHGAGPSTIGNRSSQWKNFASDIESLSSLSDQGDVSDKESILSKGKGKANVQGKGKGKGKRRQGMGDDQIKAEERALRKKLGRKLTHAEKSTIALYRYHPELKTVWGDVKAAIPIVTPVRDTQPVDLKCQLLPFQLESLHWMLKQEKGIWAGGILADEMGMGKTIQTIALLVADRKSPNLVVAPTVAIMQWRNEIASFTEGFKVLVWHGSNRENDIKELAKYDVVLTTYAVLESTFRKQESGFKRQGRIVKQPSCLHSVHWNRIILDEAHNIKERATNTAKAAFELKSNFKWCLSGTPLQNRVGELYSVVRFLGGDPFSYYFCKRCDCKDLHWKFSDKRSCDKCGHSPMHHTCFWNNEILTPIQKCGMIGPGEIAFKKLKILLDRMMLRRTKVERADDLGLPPRVVIVRRDYFSPEENELYLSLFSDAKRQFSTYVDSGTVLNNYSNIFSLITRMRQMACHPDLVLKSNTNHETFAGEDEAEGTVCRLCNDIAEDAIQATCRHIFDRECIKQYLNTAIEQNPDCPVCHVPLSIDLEAPPLELETNVKTPRQGILGRLQVDTWRSSTKIEALVEELSNLRRQDASTKSLVFSQFVNFLDLIAFRLQRAGFKICRLEGTMTPQARDATIKHFMNNVDVTVFLVSLKAGGVALNLTEASRVYLMDSWWNPAVEYQAMDRIHRLGQHRPIQAVKLVIENSIESRIVQLQEKKSAMVEATLSTDDAALGRLTPADLGFLFRL